MLAGREQRMHRWQTGHSSGCHTMSRVGEDGVCPIEPMLFALCGLFIILF